MIGWVEVPGEDGINFSRHRPPDLKRIESPGWKTVLLTLLTVLQGAASEVPALLSFPELET